MLIRSTIGGESLSSPTLVGREVDSISPNTQTLVKNIQK